MLPIQDSWIWQMHADIPLEDQTHETFWRQLLRWLSDDVPDQVGAQSEREVVEPGQPVNLTIEVRDSAYAEVNNANVVAIVHDPSGDSITVPLDWDVEQDGRYGGGFPTAAPGLYEVFVRAMRGADTVGTAVTYVDVAPSADEYFDASMRGTTLRRNCRPDRWTVLHAGDRGEPSGGHRPYRSRGHAHRGTGSLGHADPAASRLGLDGRRVGLPEEEGSHLISPVISRGTLAIAMFFVTAAAPPVMGQDTHILVITGLGGDPAYSERFMEWGSALVAAAGEKFGLPADRIIYLGEDPAADPRIHDRSTQENVDRAFTKLVSNSQPGDQHLRRADRARQLHRRRISLQSSRARPHRGGFRPAPRSALRSASGVREPRQCEWRIREGTLGRGDAPSSPRTRTGRERNETIFGGYFVDAFTGETADLNQDGRVSVWEAFEFARTEVTREYETSNRIATEHPVLDDKRRWRG